MFLNKALRRKIRYRLIYHLVKALVFFSQFPSRKTWLNLCGNLGVLAYAFARQSRQLTQQHLALVFGQEKTKEEILRLSKDVFRMLGKNGGDVLWMYNEKNSAHVEKYRKINGLHYLEEAFAKKKGILFLTAHIGAFELLAPEIGKRGYNPYIIGEPLKDKRLSDMLFDFRSRHGTHAIERGKDMLRLFKILKSGGCVALLTDQDIKIKSRIVPFLGLPASTPIGATILALRTGASVIPIFIHLREDGVQEINIYPEIVAEATENAENDLIRITAQFNQAVGDEIRRYPSQWVWMHERWKTKPGEEILD